MNSLRDFSSELSADGFNNYIITTCDHQKITPDASKCVDDQGYQLLASFFYRVTEIEIANLIATLKNKNSIGSDGISSKGLKKDALFKGSYLKTAVNKRRAECVVPKKLEKF